MEKYSLRQVAQAAEVPKTTLHRWKKEGKLAPDIANDKGELTLYSEAQIEIARKLDQVRKAKTADKPECACAAGNGDNSDGEQAVEIVDVRDDDADNLQDTPTADELHESITTPAQIDEIQGVDVAAVETPMTIETSAQIVTLDVRASRIRQGLKDMNQHLQDACDAAIKVGFELIAAKKEVGHGNWERWLQNEFSWTSDRNARYLMAVAERFGNRNTYSVLGYSALKALLALPKGEEDKFIASQASAGKPIEKLSAREVKRAVTEWKTASNPTNTFPFEDKHDQTEIRGEGFKVWQDSPTIEDVQNSDALETSEVQNSEKKKLPPVAHNFNSSLEYFTPAQYIDAARAVLGDIDLDPASCELANQTVNAAQFFTADDDGLNQEWRGRIWLNPPFAAGLIEKFVDKLIAEIDSGNVTSAIVLVDNATETRWFQKLAANCAGMVFTTGRINFLKGGTLAAGSPTRGQVFLFFGDDDQKFFNVFKPFGWAALVLQFRDQKCSQPS